MKIQICINNRILVDAIKKLIAEVLQDVQVGDHYFGDPVPEPDIALIASRDKILEIKERYPKSKFICFDLGMPDSELACLICCHGIQGILASTMDIGKFGKALRAVARGEIWLTQKHLKLVLEQGAAPQRDKLRGLSPQDMRIIQMVAEGETNRHIAAELCLSLPTVKAHLSRIFKQLNVENRSSLAALATKGLDNLFT